MDKIKKHKNKIIFGILACVILAVSFFWGGNVSDKKEKTLENSPKNTVTQEYDKNKSDKKDDVKEKAEKKVFKDENLEKGNKKNEKVNNKTEEKQIEDKKEDLGEENKNSINKDEEKVLNNKIMEEPKEEKTEKEEKLTCTLSVSCGTILNDISRLAKEKQSLVPADGIIYREKEVVFHEGESVFNVLLRELKQNKIHLEFVNVPVFKSAYIEGIGNLYEFDCGDLSGWMYKVNGEFPNYGCSQYKVKKGDKIEWVYTCDLGKDVGGEYSAKNGNISQ